MPLVASLIRYGFVDELPGQPYHYWDKPSKRPRRTQCTHSPLRLCALFISLCHVCTVCVYVHTLAATGNKSHMGQHDMNFEHKFLDVLVPLA